MNELTKLFALFIKLKVSIIEISRGVQTNRLVGLDYSINISTLVLPCGHGSHTESMLILNKRCKNALVTAGQPLRTFRASPSSVLTQVKQFLPKMDTANRDLEEILKTQPASSVDIENLEDCKGPIIEMNVALVEPDLSETSDSSETDLETSSSEGSCEDSILGEVTPENLKLRKRTKRPTIVCIQSNNDYSDSKDNLSTKEKSVPENG
ncbi:hypothetical protein CHS0354_031551 [Potamilus streckersoni]|uniref:Uncharacterized protein n=1 Tax=Potamilus streckersoni TaxID=2493646 RepID=A0AAE0SYY9_9BIVA|nr:hypothetical protein CHS0354_031551 [Potamilus streckersoni]